MKKILFGELQRYITTQSKTVLVLLQEAPHALPEEFATTIITELSHLKHVENSETVQELLAVYQSALGCTCSQLTQQSSYYTVLGELQSTLNELSRSRKTNCNQTVRSSYSAPSGFRL